MLQHAELFALITEAKWCSNSSAQGLHGSEKKKELTRFVDGRKKK